MADFSIVKRGYDQEEVNKYIAKLEEVINSYKEKDIAIKNAIISAQIAADNIVENAELEASNKRRKTTDALNSIKEDINKYEIALKSFQSNYNALIQRYIIELNAKEFESSFEKLHELECHISVAKDKLSDEAPTIAQNTVNEENA